MKFGMVVPVLKRSLRPFLIHSLSRRRGSIVPGDHAFSLVILDRGPEKARSERPELTLVKGRPPQPSMNGLQADRVEQEAPARKGGGGSPVVSSLGEYIRIRLFDRSP